MENQEHRLRAARESTISLRWVIPFLRVTGGSPAQLLSLVPGIELKDFVNPDTRVSHRTMMELLSGTVERLGNPGLGLLAGEHVEAGDFEPFEYAYRSCANLREASMCAVRNIYLLHGAHQPRLVEHGDLASWELHSTDDVVQIPAANDFVLASAVALARRYAGKRDALREVHLVHSTPTDEAGYARVFGRATVKFGMPRNALVFDRAHLDTPMSLAHTGLQAAFELRASAMLELIKRSEGLEGRVRRLMAGGISTGDVSLTSTAQRLGMSVATLRRRLAEQGTSHSQILGELRRELAARYLTEGSLPISEVAFLLGFAHVTAFYKAFGRWGLGPTPGAFRSQTQPRPVPRERPRTESYPG